MTDKPTLQPGDIIYVDMDTKNLLAENRRLRAENKKLTNAHKEMTENRNENFSLCIKEQGRLRKTIVALQLIAMPRRADGTYNRCREACETIARECLEEIEKEKKG